MNKDNAPEVNRMLNWLENSRKQLKQPIVRDESSQDGNDAPLIISNPFTVSEEMYRALGPSPCPSPALPVEEVSAMPACTDKVIVKGQSYAAEVITSADILAMERSLGLSSPSPCPSPCPSPSPSIMSVTEIPQVTASYNLNNSRLMSMPRLSGPYLKQNPTQSLPGAHLKQIQPIFNANVNDVRQPSIVVQKLPTNYSVPNILRQSKLQDKSKIVKKKIGNENTAVHPGKTPVNLTAKKVGLYLGQTGEVSDSSQTSRVFLVPSDSLQSSNELIARNQENSSVKMIYIGKGNSVPTCNTTAQQGKTASYLRDKGEASTQSSTVFVVPDDPPQSSTTTASSSLPSTTNPEVVTFRKPDPPPRLSYSNKLSKGDVHIFRQYKARNQVVAITDDGPLPLPPLSAIQYPTYRGSSNTDNEIQIDPSPVNEETSLSLLLTKVIEKYQKDTTLPPPSHSTNKSTASKIVIEPWHSHNTSTALMAKIQKMQKEFDELQDKYKESLKKKEKTNIKITNLKKRCTRLQEINKSMRGNYYRNREALLKCKKVFKYIRDNSFDTFDNVDELCDLTVY